MDFLRLAWKRIWCDGRTQGFTPGTTDIVPSHPLGAILNTTLANNGGPIRTHALVTGSPAIDAINDGTCPPPAKDQRGLTRPRDGNDNGGPACDSGAYEFVFTGTAPAQLQPARPQPPAPQPAQPPETIIVDDKPVDMDEPATPPPIPPQPGAPAPVPPPPTSPEPAPSEPVAPAPGQTHTSSRNPQRRNPYLLNQFQAINRLRRLPGQYHF
jgi:hypothetical protein